MTETAAAGSERAFERQARRLTFAISLAGALGILALITDGRFDIFHARDWFAGVYNHYFLSLADGRFDVPLRAVVFEGHFAEDGTAYVYHGLLPLVTRALAAPFVDLKAYSLAPLTVWLATVAAGGLATGLIRRVMVANPAFEGRLGLMLLAVLAVAVWVASPVIVLGAASPLYHEPIALALALLMLFLRLAWPLVEGAPVTTARLIGLALIVALCLHARPHVALGLGIALGLIAVIDLFRRGWGRFPGAALAGGLVVVGLISVLSVNALRFGEVTRFGGAADEIAHGTVWLGLEEPDSPRWASIETLGSVNPRRILPNLMAYAARMRSLELTETLGAGFVRTDAVMHAVIPMWAVWLALAAAGLIQPGRRADRSAEVGTMRALAVGLAIPGLVILMYQTVATRYASEIWPFLFVCGLAALSCRFAARDVKRALIVLVAMLPVGAAFTANAALDLARHYNMETLDFLSPNGLYAWTVESCMTWFNAGPQSHLDPGICRR